MKSQNVLDASRAVQGAVDREDMADSRAYINICLDGEAMSFFCFTDFYRKKQSRNIQEKDNICHT